MKKIIVLMLSLLLVLSMTACGSDTTTEENGKNDEQTENAAGNDAETSDDEKEEDKSAFDTSWASNDFEKLLPELPFTGWTTSQENDTTYKMELQGLNTSAATNPSDSTEPDGADKDKLISYLNSLSDYGFTVEETGAGYQWNVTDANGNQMEFMCGDGLIRIEIQKAQ